MLPKISKNSFVVIAGVLLLAPFFIAAWYCRPAADDFCASLYLKSISGAGEALVKLYHDYNGRYTANFILFFSPLKHQLESNYQWWVTAQLVFVSLSFFMAFKKFNDHFLEGEQTSLLSLIQVFLVFALMPNSAEGLYWTTGTAAYLIGPAFALWHIWLRLKTNLDHALRITLAGIVLFLAQGFSEVQSVLILFFLTTLLLLDSKNRKENLIYLIIAAIGAYIMFSAPGNHARLQQYPDAFQWGHSLFYSVLQSVRFGGWWLIHPLTVIVIIYYVSVSNHEIRKAPLSLPLLFFVLFGMVFLAAFMPYLFTGILGQHRTMNATLPFFILLLGWLMVSIRFYLPRLYQPKIKLMVMFIALAGVFSNNFHQILLDLKRGELQSFAKEYDEKTRSNPFRKLNHQPKSVFVLDPTGKPGDWIGDCMNNYYLSHKE